MQQKEQYVAVDIFKFICAIFVAGIHWVPLRDYGELPSFLYSSVICRVAVPFFFVTAGYFLRDKWQSWSDIKRYLLRLFQLYLIYTMLYLPMILQEIYQQEAGWSGRVRLFAYRLLWRGSYLQFWFFPALMIAVLGLYILRSKLHINEGILAVVAILLWTIGVISTPNYMIENPSAINDFLRNFHLAKNSRDAIFWGIPMVYAGSVLYRWREKWSPKTEAIGVLIGVLVWGIEVHYAVVRWNCEYASNWFGAGLVAFWGAALLLRIRIKLQVGRWCRAMSMWIYGMHMYVYQQLAFMVGDMNGQYVWMCTTLMVIIVVWGSILWGLSKTRTFSWISNIF